MGWCAVNWMASTSASVISSKRVRRWRRGCAAALLLAAALAATADEVFLEPASFVAEAFAGTPPAPRKLWVKPALNERVRAILGTTLPALRQKYWTDAERTVWILEASGRDRPITVGFVIADGAIQRTAILIYRESRGAEVRYPFFTDQFSGALLRPDGELDRHIDGITGATLSVHAINGLARVALLLDHEARTIVQ